MVASGKQDEGRVEESAVYVGEGFIHDTKF